MRFEHFAGRSRACKGHNILAAYVIEQTVGPVLPSGFQRSEFLLEHGAVDMILDRRALTSAIASMLASLGPHQPLSVAGEERGAVGADS